ncbi:TPA: hypothetical protein DEP58_02155 [Patescibacteria group bacterium]|nr:MAG: hypothetical protein UU98_C0020G0016 [Parcubacteria group bacterium GW2011_GWD2_42_14]HCC05087.1 hypothetical protein [Patescibacteria group bacterium]
MAELPIHEGLVNPDDFLTWEIIHSEMTEGNRIFAVFQNLDPSARIATVDSLLELVKPPLATAGEIELLEYSYTIDGFVHYFVFKDGVYKEVLRLQKERTTPEEIQKEKKVRLRV